VKISKDTAQACNLQKVKVIFNTVINFRDLIFGYISDLLNLNKFLSSVSA